MTLIGWIVKISIAKVTRKRREAMPSDHNNYIEDEDKEGETSKLTLPSNTLLKLSEALFQLLMTF